MHAYRTPTGHHAHGDPACRHLQGRQVLSVPIELGDRGYFITPKEVATQVETAGLVPCTCINGLWHIEQEEPEVIFVPQYVPITPAQEGDLLFPCPYCSHWMSVDTYMLKPEHFNMQGMFIGPQPTAICGYCNHPIGQSLITALNGVNEILWNLHFVRHQDMAFNLIPGNYMQLIQLLHELFRDTPEQVQAFMLMIGMCSGKARSDEEIASVLQVTAYTIPSLYHQVKKRLAALLKNTPRSPVEVLGNFHQHIQEMTAGLDTSVRHLTPELNQEQRQLLPRSPRVIGLSTRVFTILSDYSSRNLLIDTYWRPITIAQLWLMANREPHLLDPRNPQHISGIGVAAAVEIRRALETYGFPHQLTFEVKS